MTPISFSGLKSVLCLGAHADDIEIGCGGTLVRLLASDPHLAVHWVVFAAEGPRAEEARQSALAVLGQRAADRIRIHAFRDSYFPAQWAAIKDAMQALSREIQPDLIFTHRGDDAHQDHRTLSELTWNAFRNHSILEYEIPKVDADLGRPNCYAAISESDARRKIDNLLASFPTQLSKPWFTPDTFWALLRLRGLECNSPSRLAEGFYARKLLW